MTNPIQVKVEVKVEVDGPTPHQNVSHPIITIPTPVVEHNVKVETSSNRERHSTELKTNGSGNKIKAALLEYIQDIQDSEITDATNHEINTLPPYIRKKNPIVVISSEAASEKAVQSIRRELLRAREKRMRHGGKNHFLESFQFVGFDVQRKCDQWTREQHPALIVISTFDTSYLFRTKFQGADNQRQEQNKTIFTSLRSLLCDEKIIKIGPGIRNEVRVLKRVYGNHCCGDGESFLDLIPLAKKRWPEIQRCGLRHMTATVLRREFTRAQQNKNWEVRTLTPAMKAYAACGSSVSLVLFAAIVLQFNGYCLTISSQVNA